MYLKSQYELTTSPLFQAYIGGKKSDYEVSGISSTVSVFRFFGLRIAKGAY
jgi:hypothetical protein